MEHALIIPLMNSGHRAWLLPRDENQRAPSSCFVSITQLVPFFILLRDMEFNFYNDLL